MDRNLAGLMDAYSTHIYWNYFDEGKFEERLMEVPTIRQGPPAHEHEADLRH